MVPTTSSPSPSNVDQYENLHNLESLTRTTNGDTTEIVTSRATSPVLQPEANQANNRTVTSETKSLCHCFVALKDSALSGLKWVAELITNCVKGIFNGICDCCKKSKDES